MLTKNETFDLAIITVFIYLIYLHCKTLKRPHSVQLGLVSIIILHLNIIQYLMKYTRFSLTWGMVLNMLGMIMVH